MLGCCLIAGLGNPGKEYINTRHNVGFMAVDCIAKNHEATFKSLPDKLCATSASFNINSTKVRLIKPTVFMNNSGQAISAVANYYNIKHQNIFVIYDELDLSCGTLRVKTQGGHSGHNGIRNTIDCLGTDAFNRVRIGIGRPKSNMASYVLSPPNNADKLLIQDSIDLLATHLEVVISDIGKAQQLLHI